MGLPANFVLADRGFTSTIRGDSLGCNLKITIFYIKTEDSSGKTDGF
jgi:hypothetical protein